MPEALRACDRLIRLVDGSAALAPQVAGEASARRSWRQWESALPAALRECLLHLPMGSAAFWDTVQSAGACAMSWAEVLSQCQAIEEVVVDADGQPLLRAQRPGVPSPFKPASVRNEVVAEGAYLRFGESTCRLMSSSSSVVVHLAVRDLPLLVAAFQDGASTDPSVSMVRGLLRDLGFFTIEADPLASWSFPDRLLHAASTYGHGHEGGYGATWSGLHVSGAAASTASPVAAGVRVVLPADDAPRLGADLGTVLAERRSCRAYADRELSPADLAPLLQRALQTQRMGVSKEGLPVAFHPYPSGGACDEITTLVALRASPAEPQTPVLAIYAHHTHALYLVPDSAALALLVLRRFGAVGETKTLPPAALLFVATYGRVALKYESIAYATILRNVGAIYQTVYLVAQALGLGTCALGGGWGDVEREIQCATCPGGVVVGGMLVGWPRLGA